MYFITSYGRYYIGSDLEVDSRLSNHAFGFTLLLYRSNSTMYSRYCLTTLSIIPVTDWRWLVGYGYGNWPALVLEKIYMKWELEFPLVKHAPRFTKSMCHMCFQTVFLDIWFVWWNTKANVPWLIGINN